MKNSFLLLVFFLFGTSAQSSGKNYSNIIIISIVYYLSIDKCEIQVNGKNASTLVVYVSSNISLRCTCPNNKTAEWYHNGNSIENTNKSIVLRSVSQSDSGLYGCIVNMTYEVNITVYCK